MTSSIEYAVEVLPYFKANVLEKRAHTYGYYAAEIGLNPTKEALLVGQAMHIIRAACIMSGVPVAPLYYVKRHDGKRRNVFESDDLERRFVLPHNRLLRVTARDYDFSTTTCYG